MTPHILLLTSAEEVGGPLLVPIASISFAVPLGEITRIFMKDRAEYMDVTETFESIVMCLGGLVMKPHRGPISVPR